MKFPSILGVVCAALLYILLFPILLAVKYSGGNK